MKKSRHKNNVSFSKMLIMYLENGKHVYNFFPMHIGNVPRKQKKFEETKKNEKKRMKAKYQ